MDNKKPTSIQIARSLIIAINDYADTVKRMPKGLERDKAVRRLSTLASIQVKKDKGGK